MAVLISLSVIAFVSTLGTAKVPVPIPAPSLGPAETALYVDCTIQNLPFTLPDSGIIHVISLSRSRMMRTQRGYLEVSGRPRGSWPLKDVMDAIRRKRPFPPPMVDMCTVSNHGPSEVVYTEVPLDIVFTRDSTRTRYFAGVSALSPGKDWTFYIVNNCDDAVSVIWQQNTTASILGEQSRRTITLKRMYKNDAEQVLMGGSFPPPIPLAEACGG